METDDLHRWRASSDGFLASTWKSLRRLDISFLLSLCFYFLNRERERESAVPNSIQRIRQRREGRRRVKPPFLFFSYISLSSNVGVCCIFISLPVGPPFCVHWFGFFFFLTRSNLKEKTLRPLFFSGLRMFLLTQKKKYIRPFTNTLSFIYQLYSTRESKFYTKSVNR